MGRKPLPLLLILLPIAAIAQPFECAAGCTDRGNCDADTGDCVCPYGWEGKACEIDGLSACRLGPDSPATCSDRPTQNCECYRQCERFHCKDGVCGRHMPPGNRGCFYREGVPAEQQNSIAPEEEEEGVKYFLGWTPGAAEAASRREAMQWDKRETVAPSRCPQGCSGHGFCTLWFKEESAQPWCFCHRGFEGGACETEDTKWCLLNCGGQGRCHDYFCHCKPPYFSLGCSRNHSVPHAAQRPSPVDFKIYMYELNTKYSYPLIRDLGEPRTEDGIAMYGAYYQFQRTFMHSSVRTYDPTEANLFFIPTFLFEWTGPPGDGNEYLSLMLDHIKTKWPYWNKTGGRDHFFFHTNDRGACCLTGEALNAIKVVHFGYYMPDPQTAGLRTVREQSKGVGYSCYHPLRDVVAIPEENRFKVWAPNSKMSLEDILAQKKKLLLFIGGVLSFDPSVLEFSGTSRQILDKLQAEEWKDPEVELLIKERGVDDPHLDFEAHYRSARFCFCPYGWGWGNRLGEAVLGHCIPVIVQEHVFQPYEDVLPYEAFSVRLTNDDLPRLREILRGITDEQYRGMLTQLMQYRSAFHWYDDHEGRAYDFTIASLRRRWLNLKSIYY